MALLFMDGFDMGDFAQKYYSTTYTTSSATTRFSAGKSIAISPSGVQTGGVQKFIPASSQVIVGGAYLPGSLTQSLLYLYGDAGATMHLGLKLGATGTISLLRGATTIATSSPGLIATGTWYSIEISATINSTTGTCLVRLNGSTVINFTGNTKNGGTNTTFDKVYFYNDNGNTSFFLDDVYVCDGTGSAPYNTFLGDVRVYALSPTGAGSSTQWTPDTGSNYARVNEVPYSAANYVQSKTSGQRDTYALADLPAGVVSTIYGVQNNVIAKRTDAGAIAIMPALKSSATIAYGSSSIPGTADATISDMRTTDPNTSAAWTVSAVNALEAGMEVV